MKKVPFMLDLPFTGGLDEVGDDVASDPPDLLRAVNATFTKRGAVKRRPGFVEKTSSALIGETCTSIFERGGGVHVATGSGIASRTATGDNFVFTNPRGIKPAQVRTDPSVRVENDNVMQPDHAYLSGYVCTVWSNTDGAAMTGAPTTNTRCYVQVVEQATGVVITKPTVLPSTMRGCAHVVAVGTNFVVTAIGSDGHVRSCAFAPTASIPTSATDLRALAYTIYDVVAVLGSTMYVVAAQSALPTKFDVFKLDSSGAVTASKLDNVSSVGTSIRGIGIGYGTVSSRVWVAYVDGTGTMAGCTCWLGYMDLTLTTWTATGTAAGTFSPRNGAGNGPSLAYADVCIQQNAYGTVLVAWSAMLAVDGAGALVKCDTAAVSAISLTAATNSAAFSSDGATQAGATATTRGYRIIGRWTDTADLILLGWCGAIAVVYPSGSTTPILSNRSADKDTQYAGMMVCAPQSGSEWDSSQTPPVAKTSYILRAVARVNRDVAYSYLLGTGSLPSPSQWWRETSTKVHACAPVRRVAGVHVPGTIVFEANTTAVDMLPKACRKIHANGGVWFDGGFDGGFDGAESFEASPHQPLELASAKTLAFLGTGSSGPVGGPTDGNGWHTANGKPDGLWYVVASASWEDADGLAHRTALSRQITVVGHPGAGEFRANMQFAITDPGVLSAIELYGRLNVRIQVYVSKDNGGDTTTTSTDTTPYLAVDDVIGADTRTGPDGAGAYAHGYQIGMNGQAGLLYVIVCNPAEAIFAETLIPHYTLGDVLPAEPSHACADLVAWQDRLVSIDSEDRLRLPYTKPFEERVAPEWNGDLAIRVPSEGGDTIALAVMDEKLVVLKESAIFVCVGTGASATGQYEQISIQRLPSDVGCSERNSVIVIPDGVAFLSGRGPVLLDRSLVIRRPKSMPDTFTGCAAAVMLPHLQCVIWSSVYTDLATIVGGGGEPVLVYELGSVTLDYEVGRWATWFPFAAQDMVVIDGLLWRLDVTGQNFTATPSAAPVICLESTVDAENDPQGPFPLDVQTAWLKMAGVSGFIRLWRILVRAVNGSGLNIAMYADYDPDNYVCISTWTQGQVAAVTQGQFELHCAKQKVSAVSVRVSQSGTWGGGMTLQGLTLRGLASRTQTKNLPAGARK